MPAPQLRAYVEADLPALHALDGVCFPPDIAYSRAELQHFLQHPSAFSVVAETHGAIVGFAIARSDRRRVESVAEVAQAMHIITIDVAPGARRQGIGGLLMKWIAGKAMDLRARAIVLEAAADNRAAHSFYERFGFTITGSIPGYYNGVVDAVVFERLLDVGEPQRPIF